MDAQPPRRELIIRGVIVYTFLLVLIRITGKRQVGRLVPFDLISALTLVLLTCLVVGATYRSKWLEAIVEGRPDVLILLRRLRFHERRAFRD